MKHRCMGNVNGSAPMVALVVVHPHWHQQHRCLLETSRTVKGAWQKGWLLLMKQLLLVMKR